MTTTRANQVFRAYRGLWRALCSLGSRLLGRAAAVKCCDADTSTLAAEPLSDARAKKLKDYTALLPTTDQQSPSGLIVTDSGDVIFYAEYVRHDDHGQPRVLDRAIIDVAWADDTEKS